MSSPSLTSPLRSEREKYKTKQKSETKRSRGGYRKGVERNIPDRSRADFIGHVLEDVDVAGMLLKDSIGFDDSCYVCCTPLQAYHSIFAHDLYYSNESMY